MLCEPLHVQLSRRRYVSQCPHRMACAKCSFYLPRKWAEAQLLEVTRASRNEVLGSERRGCGRRNIKGRPWWSRVLSASSTAPERNALYDQHQIYRHGRAHGKYFDGGEELRWQGGDGIRHRDESQHDSAVYRGLARRFARHV